MKRITLGRIIDTYFDFDAPPSHVREVLVDFPAWKE
jgi:hypothetical protein